MNLEEKAKKYSSEMVSEGEHFLNEKELKEYCETDFEAGYNNCKSDLIAFIKANPKSTAEQILKHLDSL